MALFGALGGMVNSGMGMMGSLGGVASGKATNAADEASTDAFNNSSDAKNTEKLDAAGSGADQMQGLAGQSYQDAITGSKTKMLEARMKRSNDTLNSMAQIG